jgi:hypothetical protein
MITVICPSRGRPANVARLIESFRLTRVHRSTRLIIAVDSSDPDLVGYSNAVSGAGVFLLNVDSKRRNMVQTLNQAASYAVEDVVTILGFVGDDHVFETGGWDAKLNDALQPMMIAYGDDGHQHEALPTAVFMDANIVRALGWMAPPGLHHLYVDNAWKVLGEVMQSLRYFPEIKITHLHPHAGRAEWDTTYEDANSRYTNEHDRAEYHRWVGSSDGLKDAIRRLKQDQTMVDGSQP